MSNLPVVSSAKFSPEEIQLLRNTYLKGLSDSETTLFLKQAEAMNLNPFTKEIYGMVIKDRLTLITSISGLRKIAHQAGNYLGCKIEITMDGQKPVSAKATVKKLVAGHVAEFDAEVLASEYNTGKNNWATMPVTMLKKVAEAHALRMAYPSAENVYEESEVGAIRRAPQESARAKELTAKFETVQPREVTPHPDHHEDMPLALAANPVVENSVGSVDNYVIPVGRNAGKKISELPKADVEAHVKWAYSQETLSEKAQEYLQMAERFLEKT